MSDNARKSGRFPRRRDRLHILWAYSLRGARDLPLCGEEHPLRREESRWLTWGAAVTLLLVLVLYVAWRLDKERHVVPAQAPMVELPRRPFTPGRFGPLRVMPKLNIDDGTDAREQPAVQARRQPRPPAPQPAPPPALRGEPVPVASLSVEPADTPVVPVVEEPNQADFDAVEMHMPAQFNPCYVLERMARPEYPLEATPQERSRAKITVEAAFYVDLDGNVTGAYILNSEGSAVFDQTVLRAVNAWKFTPVNDPECPPLGFWIRLPVVFHGQHALRKDLLLPKP